MLERECSIAELARNGLPRSRSSNEELGTVGILSGVGHAEKTFLGMLQLKVLIWELSSVDYQLLEPRTSLADFVTYLICLRFHHPL